MLYTGTLDVLEWSVVKVQYDYESLCSHRANY